MFTLIDLMEDKNQTSVPSYLVKRIRGCCSFLKGAWVCYEVPLSDGKRLKSGS